MQARTQLHIVHRAVSTEKRQRWQNTKCIQTIYPIIIHNIRIKSECEREKWLNESAMPFKCNVMNFSFNCFICLPLCEHCEMVGNYSNCEWSIYYYTGCPTKVEPRFLFFASKPIKKIQQNWHHMSTIAPASRPNPIYGVEDTHSWRLPRIQSTEWQERWVQGENNSMLNCQFLVLSRVAPRIDTANLSKHSKAVRKSPETCKSIQQHFFFSSPWILQVNTNEMNKFFVLKYSYMEFQLLNPALTSYLHADKNILSPNPFLAHCPYSHEIVSWKYAIVNISIRVGSMPIAHMVIFLRIYVQTAELWHLFIISLDESSPHILSLIFSGWPPPISSQPKAHEEDESYSFLSSPYDQ